MSFLLIIVVPLLITVYLSATLFQKDLLHRPVSLTILATLVPAVMNDSILFLQADFLQSSNIFGLAVYIMLLVKYFEEPAHQYRFVLFCTPIIIPLTAITGFFYNLENQLAIWIFICLFVVLLEHLLSYNLFHRTIQNEK